MTEGDKFGSQSCIKSPKVDGRRVVPSKLFTSKRKPQITAVPIVNLGRKASATSDQVVSIFKRRLVDSQPCLSESTSVCTAATPVMHDSCNGKSDFDLLGFK